jgi:aryl-alcohol dehydrogenase-like predicted oxidoreductase
MGKAAGRHTAPSASERQAELNAVAGGAGDATMTTEQDTRQKIMAELYAALERLGVDEELLAIVDSMNDRMTDKEILQLLEEYNRTGKVLRLLE